jgi:hypothetical protein
MYSSNRVMIVNKKIIATLSSTICSTSASPSVTDEFLTPGHGHNGRCDTSVVTSVLEIGTQCRGFIGFLCVFCWEVRGGVEARHLGRLHHVVKHFFLASLIPVHRYLYNVYQFSFHNVTSAPRGKDCSKTANYLG